VTHWLIIQDTDFYERVVENLVPKYGLTWNSSAVAVYWK